MVTTLTVSDDGTLAAVADASFPGVLLRVRRRPTHRMRVERSLPEGAWEPVRSGDPVRLVDGEGWAYDAEAPCGRTVAYRAAPLNFESWSSVAVDAYRLRECEAWLTPLADLTRSVRVRVIHPYEPTADGTSEALTFPGGDRVLLASGQSSLSMLAGRSTLRTEGERPWRALQAALAVPGAKLLRASPEHGIDDLYFGVTGVTHGRPGQRPGWELRDTEVSWLECRRPPTTGAALVIPGWTYSDQVAGVGSLATLAAQHPTWGERLLFGVMEVARL